ncbi:MAG: nucleotidyltransferase domain-containing protein, partial [Anaerolineaceae bacterium]|nr:nucleotidyltransferase domain-containing protein [Anaerolineaceae bacterium]
EISLVYLFGSQVTGQIGPMSDYDLAIFDASRGDEFTTQAEFHHAVVALLGTQRVDIVSLNQVPVELAYHIISTGMLLYQKDLYTRVEYEAQVLGKYGDYLPTLREYKNQILQGDAYARRVQRYREALGRAHRPLGAPRTTPRS